MHTNILSNFAFKFLIGVKDIRQGAYIIYLKTCVQIVSPIELDNCQFIELSECR